MLWTAGAQAQGTVPSESWQLGAVLDVGHSTRALALGARDQGLQLGHSDVGAFGPVGRALRAQLSATVETHNGDLEQRIEEAWLETTRLPAGLTLRAGRFAAQLGYLNAQHPHADDFTERPLLYRAFFGGHWNDDGLRLNWTAPTRIYWTLGAEVFRGNQLVHTPSTRTSNPGVTVLSTKLGGDLNTEHSWQLGLAQVHNRRAPAAEEEHDHDHSAGAHHHHHGAQYVGRETWVFDATWKWAPSGNNRQQHVRLNFEAARVRGLNAHAGPTDRHESNTLSAVWRFHPSWEVGARADWLRLRIPHEDHFDPGLLRERALMLAYKPTHQQALRLQYTTQRDAVAIANAVQRAVQLQYVLSFGAHSAHTY